VCVCVCVCGGVYVFVGVYVSKKQMTKFREACPQTKVIGEIFER